jgi:PilZ domain
MPEASVERRRMPRYPVSLAVETEHGRGVAHDISATGIYFETSELHPAGAPIRFTLVLQHSIPAPLRLTCVGQVIRVDVKGTSFGIAVSIASHALEAETFSS